MWRARCTREAPEGPARARPRAPSPPTHTHAHRASARAHAYTGPYTVLSIGNPASVELQVTIQSARFTVYMYGA